jgi:dynein heavy chain 1
MKDLERVEPAVIDTQNAVKSIKKQHLVEVIIPPSDPDTNKWTPQVQSMANPPPLIRVALESVCILLGESVSDWKSIRRVAMKENFILSIVNFNTDNITEDIRKVFQKDSCTTLSKPTTESTWRGVRACVRSVL